MKASALKRLPKGTHRIAHGLYLRVNGAASRQWINRLTINGRRRNIGLGPFPVVSFATAHKAAILNQAAVIMGRDPVAERREAKRQASIPTFSTLCDQVFNSLAGTWKTQRGASNWRAMLRNHAEPRIGSLRVDQVSRADIVEAVTALHDRGSEDAARRLGQALVKVFGFAEANGHCGNVAALARPAFPKRTKTAKRHHAMIEPARVADVYGALVSPNRAGALALRFVVLTGVRSGEARAARWSEVDGDTWTIPAERMKMSAAHSVPLAPAALAILAVNRH